MGKVSLRQAMDEFKTIYMAARNLAARTRVEYANALNALIGFLERSGTISVGELNLVQIDRYLAKLDGLGYSGSTRKRKAITFRSFLAFLFRNGYISRDISRLVILPFSEHPAPRVLTQSEYLRLLEVCATNPRDNAIVTLLLQTGIRLSELSRLTSPEIHIPDSIEIRVNGSRKGRSILLNSKTCAALQGYISTRPASTSFFLSKSGKPLGNRGVEKIVAQYFRKAGIVGATLHGLRHTFAVQHLIRGTSLKTVQEIMGHQDRRMTERYIPLASEISRKELEQNAL